MLRHLQQALLGAACLDEVSKAAEKVPFEAGPHQQAEELGARREKLRQRHLKQWRRRRQ